jgi:type II secretory pathway pseudopilin PulG
MIRKTRAFGAGRPRRGITLLEVLVLVTCVAIVLGLAAVTIQVMLRLVSDSQSRLSSSLMLERLARQLRTDAHACETAVLEGAQAKAPAARTTLKLVLEPGGLVSYKVLEKSVDRDETVAGKRVRHESFMLPRGRGARFELGAEAGRAMVSLVIGPGPESSSAGPSRALEVVAVVGKHRGGPIEKPEGPKK